MSPRYCYASRPLSRRRLADAGQGSTGAGGEGAGDGRAGVRPLTLGSSHPVLVTAPREQGGSRT